MNNIYIDNGIQIMVKYIPKQLQVFTQTFLYFIELLLLFYVFKFLTQYYIYIFICDVKCYPSLIVSHKVIHDVMLICRTELGNARGNENPFLLTFGVMWFRYHNLKARQLKTVHMEWNDEKTFNEARKWVVATYQVNTTFYK